MRSFLDLCGEEEEKGGIDRQRGEICPGMAWFFFHSGAILVFSMEKDF